MAEQHTFWSVVTSRVFFVLALLALVGIGVGVGKSMLRRWEVEHEIGALQTDIHALQGKNEELSRLINYFQTPEFKEREDRLRLGLQKPGEQVVVIPGLGQGSTTTADTPGSSEPNWRQWLRYFFGS